MSNQQTLTGSADVQQNLLRNQVSLFLVDPKNEASENRFKVIESLAQQFATGDKNNSREKSVSFTGLSAISNLQLIH